MLIGGKLAFFFDSITPVTKLRININWLFRHIQADKQTENKHEREGTTVC